MRGEGGKHAPIAETKLVAGAIGRHRITGALDVIVANQDARPVVYRNTVEPGNHWVAFRLVGTRSNRNAIGAEVTVAFGGEQQRRVVDGGMGFASQNDRRLHFGLGPRMSVDRVTIRWPSGRVQMLGRLDADKLHVITEPAAGR